MVIDSLYYGDGHHHAIENASFTFSVDVLATFLRKIYKGFDTSNDFEPTMWREILRVINEATVEGLVRGNYNIDQGKEFLKSLAHSNEVFSAFKVHDMGVDMAKKLVGSDGKLKPFAEWKKDVAPIASHYCGSWLQTEYNTAVLRGQFAAEWKQYEADKDIMPNLRWMPTTSATPDDEHKGYWQNRLTLPVEDKFWNDHHPGDHWNCKCSLEQTDDPSNPEVLDQVKEVKPQKGLKTNPGKSGVMFDQTHPYFAESCAQCFMRKGKALKNIFSNEGKHCMTCQYARDCTKRAQEISKWLETNTPTVAEKEAIYDMPIEQQYVSEGKFKKGQVFRHLLSSPNDNDYVFVSNVAKAFAEMKGDCKINPRVNAKSKGGREKIYPGIQSKATPDLYIDGIGYVDVKTPTQFSNITNNAVHASNHQESIACITNDKIPELTMNGIETKTDEIFNDIHYSHDKVFWLVDGKLYEYKRPKK